MNSLADMFRGVYNAMIPAPARAYGEFMLGSNAPITERDMTPQMIEAIRAQYLDNVHSSHMAWVGGDESARHAAAASLKALVQALDARVAQQAP